MGHEMKKIALAAAAVSLMFAGAASAADMAPRYTKAPPPVAVTVYNWTGFYIGAAIGGDWIRGDAYTSFFEPGGVAPGIGAFNQRRSLSSSGFIGGVYAGYNWQAANWVFGIEADISGLANSNTTATAPNLGFPGGALLPGGFVFNRSQDWLSTVRGRVGFLAAPNVLLYGTGGVAFAENKYFATYTASNPGSLPWVANFRDTKVGWTVGAGAEWMATSNWILRAEYLYVSLPGSSVTTISPTFGAAFPIPFNWNRTDEHIGRVGIAYKFGGPVVARY
jgi:outer membrane immunogenic protein